MTAIEPPMDRTDAPTTSTAAQTQTEPAPPAAESGAAFSPAQIGVASLVATPIAGAVLASLNLAQRGQRNAGVVVVAVAAAIVAAVVAVDVQGFGPLTLLVSPLWALVAFALASSTFRGQRGRSNASVAVVAVVVWLALTVVGGSVAALLHLRAPSVDEISADAVVHADFEVVSFQDGATRADAEQIERALVATGYFDGQKRLRVVVDKPEQPGNRLRMTMLALPPLHDAEVNGARTLAHAVAQNLGHCVVGRLVAPNGDVLIGGTACP